MMKKYGLQLRVDPSQQKKQPLRRPACAPSFFENDEDDVNAEIAHQATKNKVLKDIEEQHKKALEEDPSVFDYDGVYEQIQEAKIQPLQDRKERKSKYMQTLMQKAKESESMRSYMSENLLRREAKKTISILTKTSLLQVLTRRNLLSRQNGWRKNHCRNFVKKERMLPRKVT